ncbi:MAG TPA: CAP domain-containing protein [Kofleriaceae bacterium]|jgi:hypothetical protein|nr:CAP domain-containing protein [Kofleriaceae bacterium]
MRWSFALAVAACTPVTPAPVTAAAPKLVAFAQPVHVQLTDEPVAHYGEVLPPPDLTELDTAVIAATHAIADPRLFRACKQLVALASNGSIDPAALEFATTSAGVFEPIAKPLVIRTTDPEAVVAALGSLPAGSHLGIAHADDLVVVAAATAGLDAAPFSRTAPIDGGFVIDAKVDHRYSRVDIDVAWDDHSNQQFSPGLASHAFSTKLSCQNRSGRGHVVISGIDHETSVVLARFPIWCGLEPPRELVVDPLRDDSGDLDRDKAAHRMFLLLQRDRVAAGLPPLAWDDRAAADALHHAEDLRDGVRSGAPPKFRKSSLAGKTTVSNMTRGANVDDAYAKLMTDAGRRNNAMSADMTSGGVGIAGDGQDLFVAEVFANLPPSRDAEALARYFERRIVAIDDTLAVDNELASIAQEIAVALRAGGDRYELDLILYARSRQIYRYGKFYFSVVTTVDPDKVEPMSLVTHEKIDHLGIGIVQGYSPKLGDNALWIVSVFALRKT